MTVLTIKEASLATMSVELSAIKVNNKQMSLSIFRQIKEEPYFNTETFEESGVPWGTVNYFWGRHEKTSKEKIHVIWQKADELRRCIIYPIGLKSTQSNYCHDLEYEIQDAKNWLDNDYNYKCPFADQYGVERPEKYTLSEAYIKAGVEDWQKGKREKAEKAKVEILATLENLKKQHAEEKQRATDYYNNYMKIYNKLKGNAHLYIGA